MLRTRMARILASALTAALVVVSLSAAPALAAMEPLGDPGTFGGQIKLAGGTPVGEGDATVTLRTLVSGAYQSIPGAEAVTDASGNYLITGLTAASYTPFVRYNGAGDYLTTFRGSSTSTRVYNVTIPLAYRFTGHVDVSSDGATDAPAAGAGEVEVRLWEDGSGNNFPLATTTTDSNGDYEFDRYETNRGVYVDFRYLGDGLYPIWYVAGDSVGSSDSAAKRIVLLDQDRTGDVVIGSGAGVVGTVLDSGGQPVPNMQVNAFAFAVGSGSWHKSIPAVTDDQGHYALRGLDPSLEYIVRWGATGYAWGHNDGGTAQLLPEHFQVVPNVVTTGVDGTLYRDSVLRVSLLRAFSVYDTTTLRVLYEVWDPTAETWREYGFFQYLTGSDHQDLHVSPGTYRLTVVYDGPAGFNAIESLPLTVDEGVIKWYQRWMHRPGTVDAIQDQWEAWGTTSGPLGAARASATTQTGGASRVFANATVYASVFGTWPVWNGAIADAYKSAGGPQGSYGWPVGPMECDDSSLCSQEFQLGTIAPVPIAVVTAPVISGSPVVGATLSVTKGTFSPAATSWKYQWLRDGSPIPLATASSRVVTTADFEHSLSVEVTGSRVGSMPTTTTSDPTSAIGEGPVKVSLPTPAISGTTMVGRVITAKPGTWPAGASLSYRWSADSVAIPGAVQPTLTLDPALVGKHISVTVIGKLTAYLPAQRTSAPTSAIAAASFATTAAPVISGTARVGELLSASTAPWSPAAQLSYQWYADGLAVKGASADTFTPTGSLYGKRITVKVKGVAHGYVTRTRTSAATSALVQGVWSATPEPTVAGLARVGALLTADTGGWPVQARFSYQWYANGSPITDAIKSTYIPTSSRLGKVITVRIRTTSAGYPVTTRLSTVGTAPLEPGQFTTTPTPGISGTARFGSTLTAVVGTWGPSATLKYQWLADGSVIPGATSSTYKLPLSLIGSAISLRVSATRSAYVPVEMTSAETVPVTPATFATTATPKITGIPRVGTMLTATSGTWSSAAKLTYQWLANGSEIAGATRSTFIPTAAEQGALITVAVTGAAPGYSSVTRTSLPTHAVAP